MCAFSTRLNENIHGPGRRYEKIDSAAARRGRAKMDSYDRLVSPSTGESVDSDQRPAHMLRNVDYAVGPSSAEYFPAIQSVQVVNPYFPAVQFPPSGPVERHCKNSKQRWRSFTGVLLGCLRWRRRSIWRNEHFPCYHTIKWTTSSGCGGTGDKTSIVIRPRPETLSAAMLDILPRSSQTHNYRLNVRQANQSTRKSYFELCWAPSNSTVLLPLT